MNYYRRQFTIGLDLNNNNKLFLACRCISSHYGLPLTGMIGFYIDRETSELVRTYYLYMLVESPKFKTTKWEI